MILQQTLNRTHLVSSGRLFVLVVIISKFLLLGTTSAQFTQTYGWGGAGMGGYGAGKRSYDKFVRAAPPPRTTCLPNKRLQNYISELIQGELSRLRSCREVEKLREETERFPSHSSDF